MDHSVYDLTVLKRIFQMWFNFVNEKYKYVCVYNIKWKKSHIYKTIYLI